MIAGAVAQPIYAEELFHISFINKANNTGFQLLDVAVPVEGETIKKYWHRNQYEIIINGGYFESDFSPTGFYKINGRIIGPEPSNKLSGYLVIDIKGKLTLLTINDDISAYPNVLQSGPFIIDPGGKIGIRSENGKQAPRTAIGQTRNGDIVIVVTGPLSLMELAIAIMREVPSIDRVLNLDGGPSTALKTPDIEVLNQWPIRNYIVKRVCVEDKKPN